MELCKLGSLQNCWKKEEEEFSGYLYAQMEFCPGGSLKACWRDEKQRQSNIDDRSSQHEYHQFMNWFTVDPDNTHVPMPHLVLVQMAKALIACHRLGLAHLDIKPDNILIKNRSHVKLCNFGTVRHTTSTGEYINDDSLRNWGTPGFIAPEMEESDGATNASSTNLF